MEGEMIEIKIKTPSEKRSVRISGGGTVKELRSEVSKTFEVNEDRLCLIFAGKILKDEDSLGAAKIVDGVTVHLVVKQQPQPTSQSRQQDTVMGQRGNTPPMPQPNPSSNMFTQPLNFGGLADHMGGGNFEDMQRNLQQQLMTNPDMMRSMLENPMMQQMLQSPEVIQSMMQSNPQVRTLIERNPEIGHILNNPSLMRQTMEMMRNPAMMQELMRHHDRALLNAEAFPGGMNHLTRLYRDVQEPLMDATAASNPFASLANRTNTTTSNTRQGSENNEPLPNPWSTGVGNNPPTSATILPSVANTTINVNPPSNIPSAENLHNLLGSFSDPRMQSIMEMLQSNPQFTEMAIANSPMASHPQLQEQIRSNMPQILQAFERPEVRNSLSNPRVLQAMFQIQQGLQVLQQEAPHLINIIPNTGITPATTTSATVNPPSNTSGNNLAASMSAGAGGASQAQMAQMLSSMMSIMSSNPTNTSSVAGTGSPEQMYASQLETMAQMGFPNRQANLRALIETFGDVNAAVNRILQFDP